MKNTNYSKIASRYDKNEYRQKIEIDNVLKNYIQKHMQSQYNILDLACGTGIYLYNQVELFSDKNINWHGLDASEDMLKIAKTKINKASFRNGFAEDLPYESEDFDYIVNNYAFQHFTNKTAALDEVARVLKKDGIFKMHNIAIHEMKNWWVYKYFPSAYFEDLKRFWEKELIFYELSSRGFSVDINIQYLMQSMKIVDLLPYAENRDISVLTLIDDRDYIKGLEKMKSEICNDSETKLICDFAEMFCIGKKI
jgi:ubiquinone/menaquinone biosynthesis C-methylase UbiE